MKLDEIIKRWRPVVGDLTDIDIRNEYGEILRLRKLLASEEERRADMKAISKSIQGKKEKIASKERYVVSLIEKKLSPET